MPEERNEVTINVATDTLIPLVGSPLHGEQSVAARFEVSNETVSKWRRTGRLKAVKVGQRWFTKAAALNAFSVSNVGEDEAADENEAATEHTSRQRNSRRKRIAAEAMAELERQFGPLEDIDPPDPPPPTPK